MPIVVALLFAPMASAVPRLSAQSATPAQLAARLTGKWKLNAELTPTSAGRGRGRGAGLSVAASVAPVQRGGGRGGGRGAGEGGGRGDAGAPLTASEVAAQQALAILHEVPVELSIDASADVVTIRDPRGEWNFKVNDKNGTLNVPGGSLRVKSKWDRGALKQEFSSAQRSLVKTWSVDQNDRLVLVEKIESIGFRSESKAVFDRQ